MRTQVRLESTAMVEYYMTVWSIYVQQTRIHSTYKICNNFFR